MKKLTKIYDKIDNIIADLQEVADEIEEKREALDQQLSDVNDCIDTLESAKESIEEYCEW